MPRTIPPGYKAFKGHFALKERQLLGQAAHGASLDLKPFAKNIHGPPFVKSDISPITLLTNLIGSWSFDADPFVARLNSPAFDFAKVGAPPVIAGKLSNCVVIDNTRSLISSGQANSTLKLSGGIFSITFWVQMFQAPASTQNLANKLSGNSGYRVFIAGLGNTLGFTCGTGVGTTQITKTVNLGISIVWWFVTCICVSSDKLYIRASNETVFSAQESVAFGTFSPDATVELEVGSTVGGYDSRIDELNIWDRALTPAEELQLWNGGVGKAYPFI